MAETLISDRESEFPMASSSDVHLMPGEDVSHRADFAVESIFVATFFPSLRSTLVVTDCRVIVRHPQIVLGAFPAGYTETFCPLADVSEVASGVAVNARRFAVGVAVLIAGLLSVLSMSAAGPVAYILAPLLLVVGTFVVTSAYTLGLSIRNSGGGVMAITTPKRNRDAVEATRDVIALLIFDPVEDLEEL